MSLKVYPRFFPHKQIEADGWRPISIGDGTIRYTHPDRPGERWKPVFFPEGTRLVRVF